MERLFDPSAELVVHRLLFAAPIGRATQDHGLLGLGVARELDLDAFVDRAPAVRASEFRGELLQLRLRRADDVASARLAQPREIVGAGHAAVGDPDPSHHTMPGLHSGHDRLQGPRIVGIAGEHLVAQRKAIEGHHKRDAHLLAVWAMVAGIAALGLRVAFRLALKIGARDIVEQHLVLDCKQLSATLRQMCFEGGLVREQMIKGAIQAVLVDLLVSRSQSAVRRYQSSAMCNSLAGSQNRALTRTAAIFAQAMRSRPTGSSCLYNSSRPVPRQSASARYTSPN